MTRSPNYIIFFLSISAFLFLSSQLLTSQKSLNNLKIISNKSLKQFPQQKFRKNRQRICILTGPHKTGTSSIQTNLWRWSVPTSNFSPANYYAEAETSVLKEWIWPVSETIAELESNDLKNWEWTPSKVFYPLTDALRDEGKQNQKRLIFKKYTNHEVIETYHEILQQYWDLGYHIVFGTESLDSIVRLPEGDKMIQRLDKFVLPTDLEDSQVTAVVSYRSPRINHLISIWHQQNTRKGDPQFYEWATTTKNVFGALDSLLMVKILRDNTDWNIVILDLLGLMKEGWDPSNFVVCVILEEHCKNKFPVELMESEQTPMVKNIRSHLSLPNVPDMALEEIDEIIMDYDCNYFDILEDSTTFNSTSSRLKAYFPIGLIRTLERCKSLDRNQFLKSRDDMKDLVVNVLLNHGAIDVIDDY